MNAQEALEFVQRYGVVLQAARGRVPTLVEAIVGEPIQGSWWGHPQGRVIFRASKAIAESADVLVCRLIDGRVTYVHRRLWPALVKLADRFPKGRLDRVWEEHTEAGAHASHKIAFPDWVTEEVLSDADALSISEAEQILGPFNLTT